MTYQEIFLKKLTTALFNYAEGHNMEKYPDPLLSFVAHSAYEEFKKGEYPECICPAHAEKSPKNLRRRGGGRR